MYLPRVGFSIQRAGLNVIGSGQIDGSLFARRGVIPVLVPGGIVISLYLIVSSGAMRARRWDAP